MTRIRHSASDRPRARLISTPHGTYEGTDHMTTTIGGVRFSDQLAALLDHAIAHGFRIEPDLRGKRAGGLIAYPPDKTQSQINVSERGAKFNRAHYENLRRQFYAAGLEPLPTDQTTTQEEDPMTLHIHDSKSLTAALANPENRAETVGAMTVNLFEKSPDLKPYSTLAGSLMYTLGIFINEGGVGDAASEQVRASMQKDLDEALAMASQHEATVVRLTAQLEKADLAEKAARADCAAALDRAKTAEAEATELRSALAPLRAILGKD